jgi:hypothetical protein
VPSDLTVSRQDVLNAFLISLPNPEQSEFNLGLSKTSLHVSVARVSICSSSEETVVFNSEPSGLVGSENWYVWVVKASSTVNGRGFSGP